MKKNYTEDRSKRFLSLTGFTLVEILISLLILGMGIVSLYSIFPAAWHSFSYSRKLSRVALFAQHKLEDLKSSETLTEGTTGAEDKDLKWSMSVAKKNLEPGIDLMQVDLEIKFSLRGNEYTERFVTYRAG